MQSFNNSASSTKSTTPKFLANCLSVKRKLKHLAADFLNAKIQEGHHSSVIDARAALALYRLHYEDIEFNFRCKKALAEVSNFQAAATSTEEKKLMGSPLK